MAVRTSGTNFIDESGNVLYLRGIADPMVLTMRIQDMQYGYNQAYGTSQDYWPVKRWPTAAYTNDGGGDFKFFYQVMKNMGANKRWSNETLLYRVGAHDDWGTALMFGGRNYCPQRQKDMLVALCDAAECCGARVSISLGGFAEGDGVTKTRYQSLFTRGSSLYNAFTSYAADVMDTLGGHKGLLGIELLNEPDHNTQMRDWWTAKFGTCGSMIDDYGAWVSNMVADTKAKRDTSGTCLLTMGHAIQQANFVCDWTNHTEIRTIAGSCDYNHCHLYINGGQQESIFNLIIPNMLTALRGNGKPVHVGETGDFSGTWGWGGYYVDALDTTYRNYSSLGVSFMMRWWDLNGTVAASLKPLPDRATCSGGSTPTPCTSDVWETCPDGTTVKTYSCVNGSLVSTGLDCEDTPPSNSSRIVLTAPSSGDVNSQVAVEGMLYGMYDTGEWAKCYSEVYYTVSRGTTVVNQGMVRTASYDSGNCGYFTILFTPLVAATYTVDVEFRGDDTHSASSAEASIPVGDVAPSTSRIALTVPASVGVNEPVTISGTLYGTIDGVEHPICYAPVEVRITKSGTTIVSTQVTTDPWTDPTGGTCGRFRYTYTPGVVGQYAVLVAFGGNAQYPSPCNAGGTFDAVSEVAGTWECISYPGATIQPTGDLASTTPLWWLLVPASAAGLAYLLHKR